MDSQFTAYPAWLVGPVATLASIMVLMSTVVVVLMLITNNMQLKLVQLKLPNLDVASFVRRWVRTPKAEQELDLEQGLAEQKTQKRRKRRSKKQNSKFFTLSSDNQSEQEEEDEQQNGPYDLEDDAWLAPSHFIGDRSPASLSPRSSSGGSDVFSLEDNKWCSVPITV
mmetsp:Transcript_102344/g.168200  ORF Transcript_102344/g.168200 Transcript_102344/m.168200 type:complete len:168 (-) Transcript_102344:119-622(-)